MSTVRPVLIVPASTKAPRDEWTSLVPSTQPEEPTFLKSFFGTVAVTSGHKEDDMIRSTAKTKQETPTLLLVESTSGEGAKAMATVEYKVSTLGNRMFDMTLDRGPYTQQVPSTAGIAYFAYGLMTSVRDSLVLVTVRGGSNVLLGYDDAEYQRGFRNMYSDLMPSNIPSGNIGGLYQTQGYTYVTVGTTIGNTQTYIMGPNDTTFKLKPDFFGPVGNSGTANDSNDQAFVLQGNAFRGVAGETAGTLTPITFNGGTTTDTWNAVAIDADDTMYLACPTGICKTAAPYTTFEDVVTAQTWENPYYGTSGATKPWFLILDSSGDPIIYDAEAKANVAVPDFQTDDTYLEAGDVTVKPRGVYYDKVKDTVWVSGLIEVNNVTYNTMQEYHNADSTWGLQILQSPLSPTKNTNPALLAPMCGNSLGSVWVPEYRKAVGFYQGLDPTPAKETLEIVEPVNPTEAPKPKEKGSGLSTAASVGIGVGVGVVAVAAITAGVVVSRQKRKRT